MRALVAWCGELFLTEEEIGVLSVSSLFLIKGVACIRDVGCVHPEFVQYPARICCPKVHCVQP